MLAFCQIAAALAAGTAVILKPSEITPLTGLKIQDLCGEAGLPPHLVQVVIGDGSVGAALIEHKPDKIVFTGSAVTGRKIMAAAAPASDSRNIWSLGGKEAMIVLAGREYRFRDERGALGLLQQIRGRFAPLSSASSSTNRLRIPSPSDAQRKGL